VLASTHESYIAYTYAYEGAMGIKGVRAGKYKLLWVDTVNGKTATRDNVPVAGGDASWEKPEGFSSELAVYAKRQGN
jgi:hypothetical protein